MSNDSESDEENLSPIFGFSFDEEGNQESRWKIDPQLPSFETLSSPKVEGLLLGEPPIPPHAHMGFSTAAGRPINVPEAAVKEAKKKYDWGGSENIPAIDQPDVTAPAPMGMPMIGFTTAAGKPVKVPEAAVKEAKKKFDWGGDENIPAVGQPDVTAPALMQIPMIGFTTAAGKPIKVPEAAVKEAKKKYDWGGSENIPAVGQPNVTAPALMQMPMIGFTTAAGKPIKVPEAAVKEAKKKFDWGGDENIPAVGQPDVTAPALMQMPMIGFITAAGKPIKVPEAAVKEAKKKYDWAGDGNSHAIHQRDGTPPVLTEIPPIGFSTAGGKPIKIPEAAVKEAKKKYDWASDENIRAINQTDVAAPALMKMPMIGFSTASGKAIKVPEAAVKEAKKKYDWAGDENNHAIIQPNVTVPGLKEMPMIGFTTAAGKPIKVPEAAVKEAKKKYDWADDGNSHAIRQPDGTPPVLAEMPPIGFSTASGKLTKVADKALEEAKKKLDWGNSQNSDRMGSPKPEKTEVEPPLLNVTSTSDVFDFVQAGPISPEETDTVDELTISLLHDVSTNDDDYMWANDESVAAGTSPSLSNVPSNGELIPFLKLVVVRAYPVVYCMKSAGTNLFLSEKAYLQQQAAKENRKEDLREKLLPEIEEKVRKEFFCKKFSKISNEVLEEMNADDLVLYLSSIEDGPSSDILGQLSIKKRTEIEEARVTVENQIRAAVEEKFSDQLKSLNLETRASPVFKLRVIDALSYKKELTKYSIGVISIWNPNEEMLSAIQENQMFEFHSLKPSTFQTDNEVRLSTSKGTTIHPTGIRPLENGFRRKLSTIQEILSEDFSPLLNEFDTVGIVVEVTPYTTSSGQMVHLSDQWKNILKVKFWSSLKDTGLDDQLKRGEIIACTNLQWRKSSSKNGIAYAQDVSCFQINTKMDHLRQEYQNLCEAITDVDDFTTSEETKDQRPVQEVSRISETKRETTGALEEPQTRSSIKRRYLEQHYDEPPDPPPLYTAAKRGRLVNKFVAPRRVDKKPK